MLTVAFAVVAALGIVGTVVYKAKYNSAVNDYHSIKNRCEYDMAYLYKEIDALTEKTNKRDPKTGKFVKKA